MIRTKYWIVEYRVRKQAWVREYVNTSLEEARARVARLIRLDVEWAKTDGSAIRECRIVPVERVK